MGVPPMSFFAEEIHTGETPMSPQCATGRRRRESNPIAPKPSSDNVVGSGTINPATPPDS